MEIPKRHCQEWWNCNETSYGARYVCFFVSSQWKGMVSSCCWTPCRLIINIIYNDYISLYLNICIIWFMHDSWHTVYEEEPMQQDMKFEDTTQTTSNFKLKTSKIIHARQMSLMFKSHSCSCFQWRGLMRFPLKDGDAYGIRTFQEISGFSEFGIFMTTTTTTCLIYNSRLPRC